MAILFYFRISNVGTYYEIAWNVYCSRPACNLELTEYSLRKLRNFQIVEIMSFSWFFGSKKKHSEQEETTTSTVSQNDKMDNFIFVERRTEEEEDKPTGLYPPLPYALAPQTNPSDPSRSSNAATNTTTNFLHEVPFTLSKDATMEVISSLKQDMNMVKSVQAYINFLDPNDFDYNFRLERGVLNENSSTITE